MGWQWGQCLWKCFPYIRVSDVLCYKPIPIIYRTSLLQNSLKVIIRTLLNFKTFYLLFFIHEYASLNNVRHVCVLQSKQEAVLFEIQFLNNEVTHMLHNLDKWTAPEKVLKNHKLRNIVALFLRDILCPRVASNLVLTPQIISRGIYNLVD